MSLNISSAHRKRKGKQRARDESQGGSEGVILPLDVVAYNMYDISYTIPILVGTTRQNLSLQVDTGSSDLWIASVSCTTSSCGKANGRLYDPGQATTTGQIFQIQYLQGTVSGPIVWDDVQLGGYSISNQALAAASNVQAEPLSSDFQGVLGLALPLNSVISEAIPPVMGNNPDGAAFASNLFGITPSSSAPSARFLSLCLSRPGSDQIPSLLGIGRHPSEVVSDPSKISYTNLISENSGVLFWKTTVKAITVYVDDQPKPIALGRSARGGMYPTATLDTGVPVILMTSAVANGIYGALGISPANDGKYYVPCNQPLNMTITLDGQPEISIHPLDLTAEPQQGSDTQFCTGLIQTADAELTNPASNTGDMILGVPFLRNVYTVMAYDPPDAAGSFHGNSDALSLDRPIDPRLGLLNLTDPAVAMEEFKRVRVLNQPLNTTAPPNSPAVTSEKKLSVGIDVLIGLVSFVAFCFILFAARWFFGVWVRRRTAVVGGGALGDQKSALGAYRLAHRGPRSSLDGQPDEEALRRMKFEAYMKRERMTSEYTTTDSARTRVNSDLDPNGNLGVDPTDGEFGFRKPPKPHDDHNEVFPAPPIVDPWNDTTLVGLGGKLATPDRIHESPDADRGGGGGGSPTPRIMRVRTPSDFRRPPAAQRTPSVSLPLLVHIRDDSRSSEEDLTEFGAGGRMSMVGIGTAARGGRIDMALRKGSVSSLNGVVPVVPVPGPGPSPPKELPKRRRMPSGPRPVPSDSPTT